MTPPLFTPFDLGGLTLPNRIVVSPMCQYSADDGSATDWHLQHLMQLALSGAGLVMVEATAVERRGRITHGCLGLYSDSNEAHLKRVLDAARRVAAPGTRFGIQLAHAGRKASTHVPWRGGQALAPGEDPWTTVGPSPVGYARWPAPRALEQAELPGLIAAFVAAAERAVRVGFDVIELHFAHGYLGHQFLSPLANQRTDAYGGDRARRMRFPLEIAAAVRDALPRAVPLGARISATDWTEGGSDLDDAVALASALQSLGAGYVCVSSGNVVPATVPVAPAFLAPMAARVRSATGLVTRVSGLIASAEQADRIIASGQADLVALGRAFLDDPRWVWHAADRLGVRLQYPPQYQRSRADVWPAAALARPHDLAPSDAAANLMNTVG